MKLFLLIENIEFPVKLEEKEEITSKKLPDVVEFADPKTLKSLE